jgi:LmbE family N-acetylglucosaminyl deacetylase
MQVLVLSPHRDDAAFSCGLLLASLLQAGHSLRIVNVCTVSSYAPYLAKSAENRTEQVSKARLDEDLRFVDLLVRGANSAPRSVELIDFHWQDLPLRWHTDDGASLAQSPLRSEEVDTLQAELRSLPLADFVLCPQALGGHADHRLVCRAAQRAFPVSSMVLYEDLPYACGTLARPSSELGHLRCLEEAWMPAQYVSPGRKRDFCLNYSSQIGVDAAASMEHYGVLHGGERFLALPEMLRKLRYALDQAGAIS